MSLVDKKDAPPNLLFRNGFQIFRTSFAKNGN